MEDPARPEDSIEFFHDRTVAAQMFENFKANDFVEGSGFFREIVKIKLLELKPGRISFSIID